MKYMRVSIFLLISIMSYLFSQEHEILTNAKVSTEDQHFNIVVDGNNRFAFALLQHLNKQYKGNIVCSSYSIASGLSRLALGAKGTTLNQIRQILNYSMSFNPLIGSLDQFFVTIPKEKNGSQVFLANSVWLQKDVSVIPAYQYAYKKNYFSELQKINFKENSVNSLKEINDWTLKQTNNRIHNIVSPQAFSENNQFILTTSFYLKGTWRKMFPVGKTTRKPFYINSSQVRQVDMMHTLGQYPILITEKLTMIEIPYLTQEGTTPDFSLVILLPKEQMGWQTILEELNLENWKNWTKNLTPQSIKLSLPCFRIEQKLQLNSVLQALGAKELFTPQADLTGITREKLQLSHAIHKTLIHVAEEGSDSKAWGVNMEEPEDSSMQELLIDHPFFFLIIERSTHSILSIGRVLQP
ncbi:serpin family protein [Candidatus Protochlamydia amoebophila]|nr:serpin family protein [Candidatus Protochlamydia amoebophila]